MEINKIKPEVPADREFKSYKDMETQILHESANALSKGNRIEGYLLSWASLEQFMLPRLMRFIAEKLGLDLPKNLNELPTYQIIQIYYFLSHDKALYLELEKGRKTRNNLSHRMYAEQDWPSVHKKFRYAIKTNVLTLFKMFEARFHGKVAIPSLTIYSRGWNDAISKTVEIIKKV